MKTIKFARVLFCAVAVTTGRLLGKGIDDTYNDTKLIMGVPAASVIGPCTENFYCAVAMKTARILNIYGIPTELSFQPVTYDGMVKLVLNQTVDFTPPTFMPTEERLLQGIDLIPIIASEEYARFVFTPDQVFSLHTYKVFSVFSPATWVLLVACGLLSFLPLHFKNILISAIFISLLFLLFQTFAIYSLMHSFRVPFENYAGAIRAVEKEGFIPVVLKDSADSADFFNITKIRKDQTVQVTSFENVDKILNSTTFVFCISRIAVKLEKRYGLVLANRKLSLNPSWVVSLILPNHHMKQTITQVYRKMQEHGLFEAMTSGDLFTHRASLALTPPSKVFPIPMKPVAQWLLFVTFLIPGSMALLMEKYSEQKASVN